MSGYVYIIEANGLYKIGMSTNLKSRLKSFKTYLPGMKLIHTIEVPNAQLAERYLHTKYSDKHFEGEWFTLTRQDIKDIKVFEFPDLIYMEQLEFSTNAPTRLELEEEKHKKEGRTKFWICECCNLLTERPGLCDICHDDDKKYYIVEKYIVLNI